MCTFEFRAEVNHEETRVMGLEDARLLGISSSEDSMTWGLHDRSMSHIDTVPACDRQMDGRADRQTDGRTTDLL